MYILHGACKSQNNDLPLLGTEQLYEIETQQYPILTGFQQFVNGNFIIDILNLQCKEILNPVIEQLMDGDEGDISISMCANPAGFEQCANTMIIDVNPFHCVRMLNLHSLVVDINY